MRILLIADPILTVPPKNYGGTERIVDLYAKEFTRLGHKVNIMAAKGSNNYNGILYDHKAPSKKWFSRAYRKIKFQFQSLYASRNCDFIFNHGRFDYLEFLLKTRKPIIQYQHNKLDANQIKFMESKANKRFKLICVSKDQLSGFKTKFKTKVIYNFVDTNFFSPQNFRKENYLAYLGRLNYEKGIDIAVKLSLDSGIPLKIAGVVKKEEKDAQKLFDEKVKPFLGDHIEYIGAVDDYKKIPFLAKAKALLVPNRWDEPFGIMNIEALACGTPIVATNKGSLKEIIINNKTGFLCDNYAEMLEAISNINYLDNAECRNDACRRFDVKTAAKNLLKSIP